MMKRPQTRHLNEDQDDQLEVASTDKTVVRTGGGAGLRNVDREGRWRGGAAGRGGAGVGARRLLPQLTLKGRSPRRGSEQTEQEADTCVCESPSDGRSITRTRSCLPHRVYCYLSKRWFNEKI